ncbi:MAG: MarR family transcriptional regulator [Pelolinea sp.]|nr:MarR family transcriptional regulator [Pelolinea sp.]
MKKKDQRDLQLLQETTDLFRQIMVPLWHITRTQTQKLVIEGQNGITSSQFHVMHQIYKGIDSVSGLADCMHVSRPNISRLVDELVQEGVVERHRDSGDRRNIRLTLTENGEKLIQDLQKKHSEILADQFSILDDQELRTLASAFKCMKKIIDHSDQE